MARLRTSNRHGCRHDLARFRTKMRPRKNLKISVRDRAAIACNLTCHSMPTLCIVHGDLCGSWRGRAPPLGIDFGTISRDFGRKILRPRKILKNCGPNRDKIRHATACRRSALCMGTSVARYEAAHQQSAWISARSRAISDENFCGRAIFSKISVENPLRIAHNRTRRSMLTLDLVVGELMGS